ncbi:MAG: glycoside hydrolase family 1 protein [Longimicrobiales bacterium]
MNFGSLVFPDGFRWGCATSGYQNEGDNRGSDWWEWEQGAGHIAGGQRSGRACDWWDGGFTADLAWMTRLHNNAHRLGVEWSRIEPRAGYFDDAAIDRYRSMLQALRDRGIEPMVTLHHFSNPLWFAQRGGWERPEAVVPFERYVDRVIQRLGDLCDSWITVNEPAIYAVLGYLGGGGDGERHQTTFPPGRSDFGLTLRVLCNLLLAHAAAYRVIHARQPHARVGIAHNVQALDPVRPDSRLDRVVLAMQDRLIHQSVVDAIVHGRLPRALGSRSEPRLRGTADFLGLNYYSRELVAFDWRSPATAFGHRVQNPDGEISDGNFGEVFPEGLYRVLRGLQGTGLPLFVTENGVPDRRDARRPAFLVNHIAWLHRALRDGVRVDGYFHWTLTDNFEWAEGWNLRFGLVELDPVTQARSLRKSGELYAEICKANGLARDTVTRFTPELEARLFEA